MVILHPDFPFLVTFFPLSLFPHLWIRMRFWRRIRLKIREQKEQEILRLEDGNDDLLRIYTIWCGTYEMKVWDTISTYRNLFLLLVDWFILSIRNGRKRWQTLPCILVPRAFNVTFFFPDFLFWLNLIFFWREVVAQHFTLSILLF